MNSEKPDAGERKSVEINQPRAHDWIEDFRHENGNYESSCAICGTIFIGNRQRASCKVCHLKNLKHSHGFYKNMAEVIEGDLSEMREALRTMINAKGRYNTQVAMEKLIALLPENKNNDCTCE